MLSYTNHIPYSTLYTILSEVTVGLVPSPGPGAGVPSYTVSENTPTGSQEVCVEILGAPANILQHPVTVSLGSSDGAQSPGGAQSKFHGIPITLLL